MIRAILKFFGYRLYYEAYGREFNRIYDSIDYQAGRPIHEKMSVAPPWATLCITKIKD